MRPAFAFLIIAAGILAGARANALSGNPVSRAPIQQAGPSPSAAQNGTQSSEPGAKIVVTNADDSMAHWSTCAQPNCHPGGKGIPVMTDQTVGNYRPSIDGASMLLTETLDSQHFYTNVLWPYKTKACNSCTQIHTDFWVYPIPSPHIATLEYDTFLFDGTRKLDLMWGLQWNQRKELWQVWSQGGDRWVDTSLTTGPWFGAWNHIQVADHRVIGDSDCDGTECMHYDSLALNGTTYTLNLTEPAGPIHPGWRSLSGFQFQLDANPVSHGTAAVSEYIDKANMWAK